MYNFWFLDIQKLYAMEFCYIHKKLYIGPFYNKFLVLILHINQYNIMK
jgi:hypothetical protein